jgi:ABC-type transport system involved in multi-copper enzyme maturation permease subunit
MWDYLGYAGNWLVFFFIGLIVIFLITSEVGYKTMRQNVIIGYRRETYFKSKLYALLALSLGATLIYAIIGLAIGFWHTPDATIGMAFDNDWAILRFFIMSTGYSSLAFLIAFVVRRSGVAVLLYITYVMLLEHFIKWLLHFRLFKNESINYYPSNVFEDLMPFPLYRFADALPRKDLTFDFLLEYSNAGIASVIYILVFIGIAYWSFMKRDI